MTDQKVDEAKVPGGLTTDDKEIKNEGKADQAASSVKSEGKADQAASSVKKKVEHAVDVVKEKFTGGDKK